MDDDEVEEKKNIVKKRYEEDDIIEFYGPKKSGKPKKLNLLKSECMKKFSAERAVRADVPTAEQKKPRIEPIKDD